MPRKTLRRSAKRSIPGSTGLLLAGMRILHLPHDERPRERCRRIGVQALSAVELLALIVGGGGHSGSSLALAHYVLEHFPSLHELSQSSPAALERVPGLGPARSCALVAAFEVGRRVARGAESRLEIVEGPADAARLLRPLLEGLRQEAVAALYLGGRHQVLQAQLIALGALNAAGVHPREVFRDAIGLGAAALVLGHNHPSGDPEPSEDDIRLTRRLRRCGGTLGVELLDHVVLGDGRWVSLREQRLI